MGAPKNNQYGLKYSTKMVNQITFKMQKSEWELFLSWAGQRCRSELIREAILKQIQNEKALDTGRRPKAGHYISPEEQHGGC
jgi:hypothetical protein